MAHQLVLYRSRLPERSANSIDLGASMSRNPPPAPPSYRVYTSLVRSEIGVNPPKSPLKRGTLNGSEQAF
jgi:hypothetical protein